MTDMLPLAIVRYFAARTPEEVADSLAGDAVVTDERQTRTGRAEILEWREEVAQVRYRQDILSASGAGDSYTVTCRLTGGFPGSPVELDNRFQLAGGRIAGLEIS